MAGVSGSVVAGTVETLYGGRLWLVDMAAGRFFPWLENVKLYYTTADCSGQAYLNTYDTGMAAVETAPSQATFTRLGIAANDTSIAGMDVYQPEGPKANVLLQAVRQGGSETCFGQTPTSTLDAVPVAKTGVVPADLAAPLALFYG
jgi:hypothetical protein